MKLKRLVGMVMMFTLVLSGCTGVPESAEGTFNTHIDKKQLISQRSPGNNETVSLVNSVVEDFLKDYTFGKGLTVADSRKQDIGVSVPVTLSWTCSKKNNGYTVIYTTKEDFSDAVEIETSEPEVILENLFVANTYYWQVVTHTQEQDYYSTVFCFTTKDTPRLISVNGVHNTRDLGGCLTEDGKYRVAQGKIYRGARLEAITGKGKLRLKELYNIKTDFDLRDPTDPGATLAGLGSPLGIGEKYIHVNGIGYGPSIASGVEVFRKELLVCMQPENYPMYVHCSAGRDRTGILMFHLGALLGLSKETLLANYELTYLSATSYPKDDLTGHNKMVGFLESFEKLEGETYQEKAEKFWLSHGITEEELQTFRNNMLISVDAQ